MTAAHPEFERFFLDEHPKLVALGLAWTGDRDAARDLAQEALTRAHTSWSTVALLDLPGAWVRRVMIDLLIDRHRDRGRQVRLVAELAPVRPVDPPDSASGPWWEAVRALPTRERAAVTLHYLEDLSIATVAEILEVKPGTVKASLAHARDELRATLAPDGGAR
jgi:RNA polymerase sigma-70 factor (ECF subfamily)